MSKSDRTRAQLRSAAIDLFDRVGFDETTVADIARSAGVSPMTYFRYFPTKHAVVLANPFDVATGRECVSDRTDLPPASRIANAVAQSVRAATRTHPRGADPDSDPLAGWADCWRITGGNVPLRGGLLALALDAHVALVAELTAHDPGVSRSRAEALVGASLGAVLSGLLSAVPATEFELDVTLATALTVVADAWPVPPASGR